MRAAPEMNLSFDPEMDREGTGDVFQKAVERRPRRLILR
jgi:hypothetical protein